MTNRNFIMTVVAVVALLAGGTVASAQFSDDSGVTASKAFGTPPARVVAEPTPEPVVVETVPVDYFVVPHPDDEFEVWSQVENSDAFKVFILMTRGEGTGLCANRADLSITCAQARTDSWEGFFEQMGKSDPTVPSDFTYRLTDPLPNAPASADSALARIWLDTQGRGALVAFDLGDGNLTPEEVEWAVRITMGNTDFGIPAADTTRVFGAYANATNYDCYVYPHPDHLAIHQALTTENFGTDVQGFASCASSPGVTFTAQVSDEALEAAWGAGGAFHTHYGWLGGYQVDAHGQSQIFHGLQAFYTREAK